MPLVNCFRVSSLKWILGIEGCQSRREAPLFSPPFNSPVYSQLASWSKIKEGQYSLWLSLPKSLLDSHFARVPVTVKATHHLGCTIKRLNAFLHVTSSASSACILLSYAAFWEKSSCWAISFAIWIPCIISSFAFNCASFISASSLQRSKILTGYIVNNSLCIKQLLIILKCFLLNILLHFLILYQQCS